MPEIVGTNPGAITGETGGQRPPTVKRAPATLAQTPLGALRTAPRIDRPPAWRGDLNLALPHFDTARVGGVCRELRGEMALHLAASLIGLAGDARVIGLPVGSESTLLLAAQATRYGSVYWLTSHDASRALVAGGVDDAGLVDACGKWFEETDALHRLWHGALARFFTDAHRRRLLVDRYVPIGGFQPLGPDAICVRGTDLANFLGGDASQTSTFDLHDLAHYAAATVCPNVYGNKFHTRAFRQLPDQLIDLVAGFDSASAPQHADGTLFGNYLGHLFNQRGDYDDPEQKIVSDLAGRLVPYMLGEGSLYLPGSGRNIRPSRAATVCELAVLAQNKAYEWPASELEQLMFTRGGTDGRDELEQLGTSDRVRAIAALHQRTFHEARNTLKHRAQALAYQLTIEELRSQAPLSREERVLAHATTRHLRFDDYSVGLRRDLFGDVAAHLASADANELGPYPYLSTGRDI